MPDKILGSTLRVRWPLPSRIEMGSVKNTILEVLQLIQKQYNNPSTWILYVFVTDRSLDELSFPLGDRTVTLNAYSVSWMEDGYMEILFVLPKQPTE